MLHDIEKTIGQFSDEELDIFIKTVNEEKEKRKKDLYEKKVRAVKIALKDLRDTFPYAEINLENRCSECDNWNTIDILEALDELDYLL